MRDWLSILWISVWVPIHAVGLWCQDARRFYGDARVRRFDRWLWQAYWWRDPYFLARKEGRRLPVDPSTLTYGTTPLVTIADLLQRVEARPGERFYELGCGQGRVALFAATWAGLDVDAWELLPTFVSVAERIRSRLQLANLRLHQANLLEADLSQADVVYLAGTCLDDETIDRLCERAKALRPGARVISLSFPLDTPGLETIAQIPVPVSWGRSTAYLQRMGSA